MSSGRVPLTIGALGIVFGDIGTSPLYAFREAARAAGAAGSDVAVLGVLSLMIWAILLSVSLKYVTLVLRLDNDGEGGILALATLLDLQQYSRGPQAILLFVALLGAAMLFGDGVITPAISVLSAVEGLELVAPGLDEWVVAITIGILVMLYVSQRAGTHRIGVLFGPIMTLWFVSLGILGLWTALKTPVVFMAINPVYGIRLLVERPDDALLILAAVFLTITGGEALYADLGHFGRKVITRAWYCFAMPGLILNYFGQGALVLENPEALRNPFFLLAPGFMLLPLVILSTAATIIASQAIITGVFSLTKQAIETGFMVPLAVKHTAEENESHVYIGTVNWALAGLSIGTVLLFRSSDALSHAYGIAVATAMITTSILFFSAHYRLRHWPRPVTILVAIFILAIDLVFFLPNLGKIPTGGELPLALASFALIIMVSWRGGTRRISEIIARRGHLDVDELESATRNATVVHRSAVVLSRTSIRVPVALGRLNQLLDVGFERYVFVSVKVAGRPRVGPSERLFIDHLSKRIARVSLVVGYMQTVNLPALVAPALREIGLDPSSVIYVVGHERPLPPRRVRSVRDLLAFVFVVLMRNAARVADRFNLPPKRTLEVGYPLSLETGVKADLGRPGGKAPPSEVVMARK